MSETLWRLRALLRRWRVDRAQRLREVTRPGLANKGVRRGSAGQLDRPKQGMIVLCAGRSP